MLAFCEKQRDLRKFRCPWFEISLPVPINFVARGFIQRRPWFITPMAIEIRPFHQGLLTSYCCLNVTFRFRMKLTAP